MEEEVVGRRLGKLGKQKETKGAPAGAKKDVKTDNEKEAIRKSGAK